MYGSSPRGWDLELEIGIGRFDSQGAANVNLITQGRGFLNRIYLLTLWSSLGVSLKIIYHHVINKLCAAPKVMDIKVPPAAESKRFLEEKFSPT
jgi:hypothetical protein